MRTRTGPLLWALCVSLTQAFAAEQDYSVYAAPQHLIEIEPGRHLNLVCMGMGSPTVVFESGLAEPTSAWAFVQPEVALHTRTCTYDRAGAGFSDRAVRPGTSANIVDDLHRLLRAADIRPPYLLVGHSYGGMNARLYYYTYPDEVQGLVLVDPSHEDQSEGYRMLSPRGYALAQWRTLADAGNAKRRVCAERAAKLESDKGFVPGSDDYKDCVFDPPPQLPPMLKQAYIDMQQHPAFHLTQLSEDEQIFSTSAEQLRASRRSFLELPVIVLTQSPDAHSLRSWETPRLREARVRFWYNLHQSLADSSARGEHRIVPNSDHDIPHSQPGAVIGAINDLLTTIRSP